VASEKKISTAKKRDIAPFKVNGQSHIILQQLSCGTRSNISFVSNPAQISLKMKLVTKYQISAINSC
jgi:hypothetical protein